MIITAMIPRKIPRNRAIFCCPVMVRRFIISGLRKRRYINLPSTSRDNNNYYKGKILCIIRGNTMKKIIAILCVVFLILPITSVSISKNWLLLMNCRFTASFSWRDINGTDYTTPIKDQSPAPTCEAFAFCAALETEMQYKLKEHISSGSLRKSFVFLCRRNH